MNLTWIKKNKWLMVSVLGIIIALAALLVALKTGDGPKYSTLLPKNTPVSSLGGWQRVSPPDKDPVYAYSDKIDGVAVSVSQQQLPAAFKKNTDQEVNKLAKEYRASHQLKAGDTPVYVGTSAKGPESAIFVKKSVLVLIKSQAAISDEAWVSYVNNLQ